jgi:hypothetical protein
MCMWALLKKQQTEDEYVTPFEHIILIPIQPVFARAT